MKYLLEKFWVPRNVWLKIIIDFDLNFNPHQGSNQVTKNGSLENNRPFKIFWFKNNSKLSKLNWVISTTSIGPFLAF